MGYQQYGISPALVARIKQKMKNPATKERIKGIIEGVSKFDLQDPAKVQRLVKSATGVLKENLSQAEEQQIVRFVVAQKIDPNNTFHLIKLWGMFR
ncbi:stage VI sporulation protein F [Paenibacillus dokdonensis]|uniref:Stage VI sporulation protein F n=1 Tax=Paenibacillus dokdonensis TaxID=2567944 RepID=A0ABU6GUW5_9BACL|nr:stage VI sporulation protein F [Paenibacillus dokdonensis]MEC0243526.1 stage VI sporulation protein F [Paenibacillus dokdonensis]